MNQNQNRKNQLPVTNRDAGNITAAVNNAMNVKQPFRHLIAEQDDISNKCTELDNAGYVVQQIVPVSANRLLILGRQK